MIEWEKSSQLNSWMFSPDFLEECRIRANKEAYLAWKSMKESNQSNTTSKENNNPSNTINAEETKDSSAKEVTKKNNSMSLYPVQHFASNYKSRRSQNPDERLPSNSTTTNNNNDNDATIDTVFLTPKEEQLLLQFYSGILPSLIGPNAQSRRLSSKDPKVPATANLFFRRFYLSNSVTMYDPKSLLIASAFLASKVEESMVHIQSLEDATKSMGLGIVPVADILEAELQLVNGLHFEFLCSHPYKALLALWEDIRTCLKSEKGRKLATMDVGTGEVIPITSGDLKPIYDEARRMVEDVCVSDVPLLFSAGQIALGAMMLANEELLKKKDEKGDHKYIPKVDFERYIHHRFDGVKKYNRDKIDVLMKTLWGLIPMLKELKVKGGRCGCGNYPVDTDVLKGVHKKLKKCRVWGSSAGDKDGGSGKKKKKKKKKKSMDGESKSRKKQKLES